MNYILSYIKSLIYPDKFIIRRNLSYHYITQGMGIEIGPSYLPLPLRKGVSVKYVDRLPNSVLRKNNTKLKYKKLTKINIIDNCEVLNKFENNTLDFVIANHVIEHTVNPIQTIVRFSQILKPGGVIFMAIPDRRYTFDNIRPLTAFKHLKEVYLKGYDKDKKEHYKECKNTLLLHFRRHETNLQKLYSPIHYHTFQKDNFLHIIDFLMKKKFPIRLIKFVDVSSNTDEFIVILKKKVQE
jgi:SAM-dependent methyltransferase